MNKFEKFAVYKGLAVVGLAGSAILLAGKLLRSREKKRAAQGGIEVVMSAGDIETDEMEIDDTEAGEEAWEAKEERGEDSFGSESQDRAAVCETVRSEPASLEDANSAADRPAWRKRAQSAAVRQIVRILPCGPLTERVRPTEEEEKEQLRRMLNQVIRF